MVGIGKSVTIVVVALVGSRQHTLRDIVASYLGPADLGITHEERFTVASARQDSSVGLIGARTIDSQYRPARAIQDRRRGPLIFVDRRKPVVRQRNHAVRQSRRHEKAIERKAIEI